MATRGVERPPEIHRFPDLDALLKLRLLVLHADPLAERVGVAAGIEAEHGNGALVGNAVALHAFHRRRLSRAVRTDQAEDLSLEHLERHVVHGHGPAVALAEMGDRDDGIVRHPRILSCPLAPAQVTIHDVAEQDGALGVDAVVEG